MQTNPWQRNEELIAKLKAEGTIKGEVSIHLFLKNARDAAFQDGKQVLEIAEGLEGYYWVLSKKADATRLREANHEVLTYYQLEKSKGISIFHEPRLKAPVELDPLGSVIFELGDGKKIRCEIELHKGEPRLKVSDDSLFGTLSMRPVASNVLTVTCASLFS